MLPACRLTVAIIPQSGRSAYVDVGERVLTAPADIEPAQLAYIIEKAARLISEGSEAVPEAEPIVALRIIQGGAA